MSNPRVVMIGLDGASWRLLRPWALDGLLPNLGRVLREGATGPLRSTLPPLTPTGWASAATGKNPGKHNIFSFYRPLRAGARLQVLNARDCRAARLWQIVNAYDRRAGILHHPLSYPVDAVDGFMVSGMMTPTTARDVTHPPELLDELLAADPDFRINVDTTTIKTGRLDEFYRDSIAHVRRQRSEMVRLMAGKQWDLFWATFFNVDPVAHFFWKYADPTSAAFPGESRFQNALLDVYREADRGVGDALDALDGRGHLVILSDHGMEPTHTNVCLSAWLVERGYLAIRSEQRHAVQQALVRAGFQRERLVYLLKRARLGWVPKLFPERLKDRVPRSRRTFKDIEANVDWARTRAYFPLAGGAAVWLNVRGREPGGTVEPGEYEALRAEIVDGLLALRDDRGRPVIREALTREQAYEGPYTKDAPDILLLPYEGFAFADGVARPVLRPVGARDGEKSGNHHVDGIVALHGPEIRPGASLAGARIIDVAPTVLHLMDLPVQDDMDGRVLADALTQECLDARPVRRDQAHFDLGPEGFEYSDDDRGQIEARLKEMGYM